MKKILIPVVLLVLVLGGAGGWYVFGRGGTPLQNAKAAIAKGDTRAATIELRNAIKDDPSDGEAHFRLGELQLKANDPVAAEKELKLARGLAYDPDQVTPLLGQALLVQRRFPGRADRSAGRGQQRRRRPRKFLLIRAAAQGATKDFAGAQASLAAAERAVPKDVDIKLAQARLALANNDMALAERRADEAIALDDKRTEALVLRAQMLASKADQAGALVLMNRAVEASPTMLNAKLERANLLINMGQDAKAQADVDQVLQTEPRSLPAIFLNSVLYVRASKFTEADAELTKLGPAVALFPRALYFQGLARANIGQFESAADSAGRYAARFPADADGVRLLARIEIGAKHPARAIEALQKAIAGGMKDPETLDLLGRAYSAAGMNPEAARLFQQASNAAPQDPSILVNLAASRLQLGDSSGASNALERSLEIAPGQGNAGEALVATALSSGDVDRAEAALERLRKQNGNTESVGLMAGLIRLARQDLEGARKQFEEVVKQFPASTAAQVNVAKVLLMQSRLKDGEQALRDILAKDPAEPQALSTLLLLLTKEGRVPDAIEVADAAHKAKPADEALTAQEADLLTRSGSAKKALDLLETARVNGQLSTTLKLAQARAQFTTGAIDDAKSTYRQVLLVQPNELEARRALTEILINNREFADATATLREGLRTSPGNVGMMTTLILIEQRVGGLPAAIKMAEDLRKDPANMPAAVVLKGDAYMAAQRYGDAASAYADEQKSNPGSPLVIRQAQALAAGGGFEPASGVLRTWLKGNPGDPDAAQLLAAYDINAKRLPDAEQNLKIVLDKRPNDGQALNNLAWVYQQRGNGLARQTAQRAYLLAPSAETADTLGWIMVTDGKAEQGLPLLKQASAQLPEERNIRFHLAKAQSELGQKDDALANVKLALTGQAEFDERARASELLDQLTRK